MPIISDQPKFEHDCDRCIFFGRFESVTANEIYDLYWCSGKSQEFSSLIARFDDEDYKYISTSPPEAFADPTIYLKKDWYVFMLEEAKRRGLYDFKQNSKTSL